MNAREQTVDERSMDASEWVLRLQDPNVDEQTMEAWLNWCQADRENFAAFESVRQLWGRFEDRRLSQSLLLERSLSPPVHTKMRAKKRSFRRAWAWAASVLLSLGGVGWWYRHSIQTSLFSQSLHTSLASLQRQALPDGSLIELGARSQVRVRLTETRRELFVDDGEAFFRVARDPRRPFVVRAGELQVTALGTAFNIRKADDCVIVTVKEGAVRVATHDAFEGPAPFETRADAGRQIVYSKRQHALTMIEVQLPASPSSWQVGRLEFVNEPLSDVVADVNRYSSRPIKLTDARLGELIFTGTLRSDAIDDWLRGLKNVFPVDMIDRGAAGVDVVRREER